MAIIEQKELDGLESSGGLHGTSNSEATHMHETGVDDVTVTSSPAPLSGAEAGSSVGAEIVCATSIVDINFVDVANHEGQTDSADRAVVGEVTGCRAVDRVAYNNEEMDGDPSSLCEHARRSEELFGKQVRIPPGLDSTSLQLQKSSNADNHYSEISSSFCGNSAQELSLKDLSADVHHDSQTGGQSVDSSCPAADGRHVSKQGISASSGQASTKEGSVKLAMPKPKHSVNKMSSLVPKAVRQSTIRQAGARPISAKQSPPRKNPGKGTLAKPPPAMSNHHCKGGQQNSPDQSQCWAAHQQQNALWQLQREHVFHNQAMPTVPRSSSRHKYQDFGGQVWGESMNAGPYMQQSGHINAIRDAVSPTRVGGPHPMGFSDDWLSMRHLGSPMHPSSWPCGPLLPNVPWDPMSSACGMGSAMNPTVPFGLGMRSRTAAADALKKFAIAAEVRAMTQAQHVAREQKAILGHGLHPKDSDSLLWPPNPSKVFEDEEYEVIRRAAAEKAAAEIKAEVVAMMQQEGRPLEPEICRSSSPSRRTYSKNHTQDEEEDAFDDISHKQYEGRIKAYNAVQGFGFIHCPELWQKYGCDVFLKEAVEGGMAIGGNCCFGVDFGRDGKPQARGVVMADVKTEGPSTAQPIRDQSVLSMAGQVRRGRVKSFNAAHGFGFVACPELQRAFGVRDIYVSRVHTPNGSLSVGQEVDFRLTFDKLGQPQARDVALCTAKRPGDRGAAVGSVVPASNVPDPLTFGMRLFT